MEFNAGIFSFTGTRSSLLNIFLAAALTMSAPAAAPLRAPGASSFLHFILDKSKACRN
jgi:hypothetical protein